MNAIFTIGYQGADVGSFFAKLLCAGINYLVDVRKNPISRKKGYSKSKLVLECERRSIIYIHFPTLGIPSELRKNLNTEGDYERLLEYYQCSILKENRQQLNEIEELTTTSKVALLCFEANPNQCHRNKIARQVASDLDIRIVHL